MPSKQETFNEVYLGIKAQGGICTNDEGSCMYRNEQNHKCAVGMLIPDDKYDSLMDNYGALDDGNELVRVLVCDELGHDYDLLNSLQTAHDIISGGGDDDNIEFIMALIADVGKKYGLKIPE